MSTKFAIATIAVFAAASLVMTPPAKAGGKGLGVGLGILAVGVLAHSAQKAHQAKAAQQRAAAQARAKAQAQARARAQAQAAAARKQELAAKKAKDTEKVDEVAAEDTNNETNEPTPSSTAALTQVDVNSNEAHKDEPVETKETVATAETETAKPDTKVTKSEKTECRKFFPALGVTLSVACE